MSSQSDASVKLLSAVDQTTTFTIDDVALNDSFDVIADIEIGDDPNKVVVEDELRVAVRNLTQSNTLAIQVLPTPLTPSNGPRTEVRRVTFAAPSSGGAVAGDVLQAVASYTVRAGVLTDFSTAESSTFVVS